MTWLTGQYSSRTLDLVQDVHLWTKWSAQVVRTSEDKLTINCSGRVPTTGHNFLFVDR